MRKHGLHEACRVVLPQILSLASLFPGVFLAYVLQALAWVTWGLAQPCLEGHTEGKMDIHCAQGKPFGPSGLRSYGLNMFDAI